MSDVKHELIWAIDRENPDDPYYICEETSLNPMSRDGFFNKILLRVQELEAKVEAINEVIKHTRIHTS